MIDDIEYLKQNSASDSIAFYIDSSTRDRKFWPTPSEYSLTFEQPFKFVYGFDILDAAIPTTAYNVEDWNNALALTLVNVPTKNTLDTAEPFIADIVWSKDFIAAFENPTYTMALLITEAIAATYNLQILSSSIPSSMYHAYIRKEVSANITLKKSQLASEYYFFDFNNKPYAISTAGNTTVIDIIAYGNYSLQYNEYGASTIVYYTSLNLDSITYQLIYSSNDFLINIEHVRRYITIGNYDISTLRNELNTLINTNDIILETTTPAETLQGKYKFSSPKKMMILNSALSTISDNIGFSLIPSPLSPSYGVAYRTLIIGTNNLVYYSIYDSFNQVYKLEAPGLVNLFGERFVVLKIKEIEDHLLGSYSYQSFSPGIGIFKLASSFNDVTNLRFDYTNLVRKPFHPVGKVNRLTFRFETAKGKLYDFKGVNHQMLMVIKFLVPTQKVNFSKSILNPNYDPNFIKYLANNQTIRNKDDSDKEEDFDDADNRVQYQKEMKKYDYSTSEESSSGAESSDSEEDIRNIQSRMRQNMGLRTQP